jgi:hypothetical protein
MLTEDMILIGGCAIVGFGVIWMIMGSRDKEN